LRTNLCLQYKPQFIASAAIYLASKFLKYTLAPDGKKAWWEVLDAKIEELEGMLLIGIFMFSKIACNFYHYFSFFACAIVFFLGFLARRDICRTLHLFSCVSLDYCPSICIYWWFCGSCYCLPDISNQILDLYESTPNLTALKAGDIDYGSGSFFSSPTTPPHVSPQPRAHPSPHSHHPHLPPHHAHQPHPPHLPHHATHSAYPILFYDQHFATLHSCCCHVTLLLLPRYYFVVAI
jgi:hypothetical protein